VGDALDDRAREILERAAAAVMPCGSGDGELEDRLATALATARAALLAAPRDERAELYELAFDILELQRDMQTGRIGRWLDAVSNVQGALSRLRGVESVALMIDKATAELCRTCGFDRAILFRVEGSEMIAESVHFEGDPEWAAQTLELAARERPRLTHMLLETDMIRRRGPALVLDPQNDERTFKPIVVAVRTRSYVAAPIMPEGRVIGFLHADCYFSGREVDALDRDTIWAFAEGFGYAIERTILLERLRAQRREIRELVASTDRVLGDLADAELDLARVSAETDPIARTTALMLGGATAFEGLLTRRELEVMDLMAAGATNVEIANRLVISEGTVKSHVKHILRKLHAGNRAEAVSRYLRPGVR
jgi:LuxR family transcriptional regulator, regulator of acetate metabolism